MNTKRHRGSLKYTFRPLNRTLLKHHMDSQTAISGNVGHMLHRSLLLEEGGMVRLEEWGNFRSYPATGRQFTIAHCSDKATYLTFEHRRSYRARVSPKQPPGAIT
jgi:hypothetical protein